MSKGKGAAPRSWLVVGICFALGVVLMSLGNVDRAIWSMSSYGEPVAGRVIDMHSIRATSGDPTLSFLPRVSFTDPGGIDREITVKAGSPDYNFRKGDRVTVLWRAENQTISIQLPFQRHWAVAIVMWVFTAVGIVLLLAAFWFVLLRIFLAWRARRARRADM